MIRCAHLNDGAFIHEDHLVGDFPGKAHFMGYHHHGHTFPGQGHHHLEYLADHFRVKSRGGFIKEHNLGFHGKRPGNGHPLLLTTGQHDRIAVRLFPDPHLVEQGKTKLIGLALSHFF